MKGHHEFVECVSVVSGVRATAGSREQGPGWLTETPVSHAEGLKL